MGARWPIGILTWSLLSAVAAGADATPAPAAGAPAVAPAAAPAPNAAPFPAPSSTAPPGVASQLNNQQVFAMLDRVRNIIAGKNLPRDGSATIESLSDELRMVELTLGQAADKTGDAAQAGYIMHASILALCGHYDQAATELRLVIIHGSGQGRLAAYKELAEVLLQEGKASELDELAAHAEAQLVTPDLVNHIRMLANYLHIRVGEGFPSFSIADIGGTMHTLADYQGRVLVIDFWASWCKPCVENIPSILKSYARFHAAGLDILGVNVDSDLQQLQMMVKMSGMSWPQALDPRQFGSPLLQRYGVWGLPANFVIGPDGTLIAKNIHGANLDQLLAKLLKQP